MSPLELSHVPPDVLEAHLVVGANVATFQHGPKGLDSVGVRHAVHVLPGGVLHRLMAVVRNALVGCVFVGE